MQTNIPWIVTLGWRNMAEMSGRELAGKVSEGKRPGEIFRGNVRGEMFRSHWLVA